MPANPFTLSECDGEYRYEIARPVTSSEIIQQARELTEERLQAGPVLSSPRDAEDHVVVHCAELEQEVFACMFLDNRHRVLAFQEMFRGTVNGASVHPREVVKAALRWNAAAVIVAHNHPSGVEEPSRADVDITRRLGDALSLVDVRLLDHLVVGGSRVTSFAERGLI